MRKLRTSLEAFGWQDYSCATLAEVFGGQLREMLRSVACRCVAKDWAEDLGSKPKLCVLKSVCVSRVKANLLVLPECNVLAGITSLHYRPRNVLTTDLVLATLM